MLDANLPMKYAFAAVPIVQHTSQVLKQDVLYERSLYSFLVAQSPKRNIFLLREGKYLYVDDLYHTDALNFYKSPDDIDLTEEGWHMLPITR
ncbi:unnamed protein product [Rotaria sp. Silwood1]|nr:unnamed protein product [Rotaria sp. Silwood1]CAF4855259.1 unnamed protein product [Rotaria sp. Silwood1]